MSYVITNDKNYLRSGSGNVLEATTNINMAMSFTTYVKAFHVIQNLPKSMKNLNYHILEIKDDMEVVPTLKDVDVPKQKEKELRSMSITTGIQCELEEMLPDYEKVLSLCENFDEMVFSVINKRPYLEQKLAILDGKLIDIEHSIEFYNVNACEGYKLYKELKNTRVERRKVKNAILIIDILKESLTDTYFTSSIGKRIGGINSRAYHIRQSPEFFK